MDNITVSNTDCAHIRSILNDGKFELTSAYERGLFNASQFYENFKRLSDKFAECGLEYGAEKFRELFEITAASRFEAKWQTATAVLKIAEIWNYVDLCMDRLNFYEILDEMNADID
ncbi:MAG: hypothetical protein FWD71_00235 [Oscillospiraceae bacterium]|nr:hypothetical protein [Oscillospiraceae bacterium]